jgi:hypothetical protein
METGTPDDVSKFRGIMVGLQHQVKQALSSLNPAQIREKAERKVRIGLVAPTASNWARWRLILSPRICLRAGAPRRWVC